MTGWRPPARSPRTLLQGANVGDPVAATDLNTSDTLTYTLDDSSGLFEIDGDGQITIKTTDPPVDQPFDYETGTREYLMDIVVSDDGGLEDKIDVKVVVTNVNEAPSITRTTGDDMLTFAENTATTRVLRRYTATDPDTGDSVTWSVEGTDGTEFTIDASGNLRFATPPDYEAGATRSITIVATDAGNPGEADELTAELPVTVTITNVDEPPAVTGEVALSFRENTATTTILHDYDASDPEGVTSIASWSLSGTDSGDFELSQSGELTFKNVPDYDRPADSGGNNEYNVTISATDDAIPPKTGRLNVVVTIMDVDEPPVVTGNDMPSFDENRTGRIGRYNATDPEGKPVTWSLSGSERDNFVIDSNGYLSFVITPNFEAKSSYFVSVVAADESLPGSLDVVVTINDIDEPPVVSGVNTIDDYDENGTDDVATYTATDPEGDTDITWTLGGSDSGDFDITGGVLSFKNAAGLRAPRRLRRQQSLRGHRLRHRLHQQARRVAR